MLKKFYARAYIHSQNVKDRMLSIQKTIASDRGEWLGSLAWTAVYAIAAIVVAGIVVAALNALGNRVGTTIGNVSGS